MRTIGVFPPYNNGSAAGYAGQNQYARVPAMEKNTKNAKHKTAMKKQKARVDAGIEAATLERGVAILLTGDGKGKSSSAFGMVMRALGYDLKVGVVQFIKGEQLSGEEIYLREHCPQVTSTRWVPALPGIHRTAARTLPPPAAPGPSPDRCYRMPAMTWWYWMSLPT